MLIRYITKVFLVIDQFTENLLISGTHIFIY